MADGEGRGTYMAGKGTKYEGQYKNDKRSGRGILTNALTGTWRYGAGDGTIHRAAECHYKYDGSWENGREDGRGTITYVDGYIAGYEYTGDMSNGTAHGTGVLRNESGRVLFAGRWINGLGYEGAVNSGKLPHGQGKGVYFDGSNYEGDWVNGKREGIGKYTDDETNIYEGEWKDDFRQGLGTYTSADGAMYEGGWKMSERSGTGTYTTVNGSTYVGNWAKDLITGEGVLVDGNGTKLFEGWWNAGKGYEGAVNANGRPQGKGVEVSVTGIRYEGDWIDGKKEGKGRFTCTDGSQFEGDFIDDKPKGKGRLTLLHGIVCEGDFEEGRVNGGGLLTDENGVVLFKGVWKDNIGYEGEVNSKGEPHGKGVRWSISGDMYRGEWVDGKLDGNATCTYTNGRGDKYEGEIVDNIPNGEGLLTDKNGIVLFKGVWKNGFGYKGEINSKGEPHGKGVMWGIHGTKDEGDWVDGKMNGTGVLLLSDGRTYEGDIVATMAHGEGVMKNKNGRVMYKGIFKNGEFVSAK